MPPYSLHWHELTNNEQEKIKESKPDVKVLMLVYDQPPWCGYPKALNGIGGCMSLLCGYIHKKEDCGVCEFKHE